MSSTSYEFLDSGEGRRLERFGPVVVDRPAPAAHLEKRLSAEVWKNADLRYSRESKWVGEPPEDWRVVLDSVTMALRPASGGQVGVFPEHVRVGREVSSCLTSQPGPVEVLHLFAHTGLVTLSAAGTGNARLTHVDASPASVRQARENATLSGLADQPIRWIVDDVMTYLRREGRRGRRYGCIIADPPAYGRSRKGGEWKLRRDLPELLAAMRDLLQEPPGQLYLTCHEEGLTGRDLSMLATRTLGGRPEVEDLYLEPTGEGAPLTAGVLLRWRALF